PQGSHRLLLRIHRRTADVVARLRRWARGPRIHRRVLRSAGHPQYGARPMSGAGGPAFTVLHVVPEPYAAVQILPARVSVCAPDDEPVHAIALRCQVRIEPLRRGYSDDEAAGLTDLFRPPQRLGPPQHTFP